MRRRSGLALVCALSVGLTGAACGKTESEQEQQPVTLRTVTMFGAEDANMAVYQQIRREFEEEYGYITVVDESGSSDEQWKEGVAMDFCVGNEPDVLQFFTDANADQLIFMDKFVTLEEIRSVYPEYAADTYDWALEQVANRDGVQRAVPTCGFWEGMYCNRDLFERYGVALPTDWESLCTAIRVFRENNVVPIACSLSHVPHYWMEYLLLFCSGEETYLSDCETVPEDWVRALTLFADLREMGGFRTGRTALPMSTPGSFFPTRRRRCLWRGTGIFPSLRIRRTPL